MNTTITSFLTRIVGVGACAAILGCATDAQAISFDLYSTTATKVGGNTTSTFYQATPVGNSITVAGTAQSYYSATAGGAAATGWWVKIAFGANPQPVLDSAFIKAGNFHLWWDSADLAAFNSGTYDSITIWNSLSGGIKNPTGNSYLTTSHAGINGTLGKSGPSSGGHSVADAGGTLMLLGSGLAGLAALRRWVLA